MCLTSLDPYVKELLFQWQLEHLCPIFEKHAVTFFSLRHSKEEDFKELIPQVGARIAFLYHWKDWKSGIELLDLSQAPKQVTAGGEDLSSGNIILDFPEFSVARSSNDSTIDSTVKEITSQLNIDSSNISFREVKWLKINGNCIRLKTNLTFDICEVTLLPIFVDVENIVTFGESGIALLCAFYDTLDFNEHFFAYQIRRTDRVRWLRFEAIMRHVPNNITIMSNMDIYVTLRCPID